MQIDPVVVRAAAPRARRPVARTVVALAVATLAGPLAAKTARAQSSGAGFLFHPPAGSLTIRGGYDRPLARGDAFADPMRELTLGRGDFAGPSFGLDLGFRLSDRVDLVLGTAYSGSSADSEFRHFVDNDDRPIEQTTQLRRVPVTAGLKAYLVPRGRQIGRFAWIPSHVAPFVGAGGGALWYRFEQTGDFIDNKTLNVFTATFQSQHWTGTAHALAGVDVTLSPRLALTTEARYTWARAPFDGDYSDYPHIDLSGVAATAGLSVRF